MTGAPALPLRPHRPATRAAVALVAVLLAVGFGLLFSARPAAAHASLIGSDPSDGARLDTNPDRITLTFTENVSSGLGAVRVLDANGDRVDRGDVSGAGAEVSVGLDDLDDGPYIVAWRVVSADSHPIHGSFTFVVGDGERRIDSELARQLLGDDDSGPWKLAGTAARYLAYGGVLVAVGLALFTAFVHDGGPERSLLRRIVRVAAGIGAAGLLLELPPRAALATGLGPDSLFEDGVARQLLGDRVGITIGVILLALLLLAVEGGRDKVVAVLAVVGVSVAFALSGHTATTSPAALSLASDSAHVAAAAAWIGGVVGCLVVVVRRLRHGGSSAAVVVRFSGLASVALVAVAVAGLALGWSEVRSMQALGTTTYGRLLMVKVAVVGVLAFIGAWNRYRVVPVLDADLARTAGDAGHDDTADAGPGATGGLDAGSDPATADGVDTGRAPADAQTATDDATDAAPEGDDPATLSPTVARHLRTTLGAEAALMALVLLLTAFLVDVTPARSAVAAPFAASAPLGSGTLEIDVEPTRAGPTTMHIYAYDETGQLRDLPDVELRFSLPAADVTGLVRVPETTGTGHWTYQGDDLSVGGLWTIEFVARPTVFDEESASFEVQIQP